MKLRRNRYIIVLGKVLLQKAMPATVPSSIPAIESSQVACVRGAATDSIISGTKTADQSGAGWTRKDGQERLGRRMNGNITERLFICWSLVGGLRPTPI